MIMGLVFLVLSPTILLPETWKQMGLFAGGKRISHDGYEFMNKLYTQRFDDWLQRYSGLLLPCFHGCEIAASDSARFSHRAAVVVSAQAGRRTLLHSVLVLCCGSSRSVFPVESLRATTRPFCRQC